MSNDIREQRRVFGWALPASVVVHLVIAALLIFGLPVSLLQPQKEEAIAVDLVPPPKPPEKKPKVQAPPPAKQAKDTKPQEAKVEKPPQASDDAAKRARSPDMQKVIQYGEKDAGPRRTQDGNSAKDGSAAAKAPSNPDKQEPAGQQALAAAKATDQVPKPGAPAAPAAKPTDAPKAQKPVKLQEAKRLFSPAATGDPIATIAMANIPRGVRFGRLCGTELREQLLNASPAYLPDFIPRYEPAAGTTIEVRSSAFSTNRQWYNLSFRCEVDADATRVVSFAFGVGDPIPPSEWARRGLPPP